MKKNTAPTLQSAQVKQIMHTFFTNAAPLFCCRPNSRREALSVSLLDLILDVFEAKEYSQSCRQIVSATDAMQNVTDGLLLHLDDLSIPSDLLCYFDMKAACLRQPGLPQTATLDVEMLQETVRQAGTSGQTWAIRTGACLNWLEVDPWCSRENAMRMWKMLAFSGDLFAMRALEYGLRAEGSLPQATVWRDTRMLYEAASNQFLTILPRAMTAEASNEAADLAQLMISIRGTLRDSNGCLPLPMLQYAAESRDTLQQKLQYLCAGQDAFRLKLLQEQKNEGRQFGF